MVIHNPAQFAGARKFYFFNEHLSPEDVVIQINAIVIATRVAGAPTHFDHTIDVIDAEAITLHQWVVPNGPSDPDTGEQTMGFQILDTEPEIPIYREVTSEDPGAIPITIVEI